MFDFLNKNKVGGNKSKSPRKKVGPLFTGSPVQTITLKNKGIPKSKFSSNKIRKNISDKDLYKVSRPSNGGIPARFHHIQENVATPQGASSPRASQIGINTTLKSAKYFGAEKTTSADNVISETTKKNKNLIEMVHRKTSPDLLELLHLKKNLFSTYKEQKAGTQKSRKCSPRVGSTKTNQSSPGEIETHRIYNYVEESNMNIMSNTKSKEKQSKEQGPKYITITSPKSSAQTHSKEFGRFIKDSWKSKNEKDLDNKDYKDEATSEGEKRSPRESKISQEKVNEYLFGCKGKEQKEITKITKIRKIRNTRNTRKYESDQYSEHKEYKEHKEHKEHKEQIKNIKLKEMWKEIKESRFIKKITPENKCNVKNVKLARRTQSISNPKGMFHKGAGMLHNLPRQSHVFTQSEYELSQPHTSQSHSSQRNNSALPSPIIPSTKLVTFSRSRGDKQGKFDAFKSPKMDLSTQPILTGTQINKSLVVFNNEGNTTTEGILATIKYSLSEKHKCHPVKNISDIFVPFVRANQKSKERKSYANYQRKNELPDDDEDGNIDFDEIEIKYLDFKDIHNLQSTAKFTRSSIYMKIFKKEEKNILLKGISTIKRISYWKYKAGIAEKKATKVGYWKRIGGGEQKFDNKIVRDIARTFPNLKFFSKGEEGHEKLLRILHAISKHHKSVGYCQGMNFVGGIVLLILGDEEESFWMMVYILGIDKYKELMSKDFNRVKLACFQIDCLIQVYLNDLYLFFNQYGITPIFYAIQWIITLFSYDFPIEICTKVIDLFIIDGFCIIFQLILAVFSLYKHKIMKLSYEEAMIYLKVFTRETTFDEELLFEKAQEFKVTKSMLEELETLYNKKELTEYDEPYSRVLLFVDKKKKVREWMEVPAPQSFNISNLGATHVSPISQRKLSTQIVTEKRIDHRIDRRGYVEMERGRMQSVGVMNEEEFKKYPNPEPPRSTKGNIHQRHRCHSEYKEMGSKFSLLSRVHPVALLSEENTSSAIQSPFKLLRKGVGSIFNIFGGRRREGKQTQTQKEKEKREIISTSNTLPDPNSPTVLAHTHNNLHPTNPTERVTRNKKSSRYVGINPPIPMLQRIGRTAGTQRNLERIEEEEIKLLKANSAELFEGDTGEIPDVELNNFDDIGEEFEGKLGEFETRVNSLNNSFLDPKKTAFDSNRSSYLPL